MVHKVRTSPAHDAGPLTIEAWGRLAEDERGEWVDGRLVEEEMPDYAHETVVAAFVHVLRAWALPRGGFVAGSGVKFAVSDRRGRMPDVHVFLPGRPPPPRSGVLRAPPDIMIEVLSPEASDRRRDRVEKLREYAEFGVRWYWIIDPEARTIEVLELGSTQHYVLQLAATTGVVGPIAECPELVIDLDAVWAELDRLGPSAP
jgi:Uma2 family endonuclease